MLLGSKLITSGDIRRYEVDYTQFLQPGDVIATAAVSTNGKTSSATSPTLDVNQTRIFFFVQGGVVGETFTASIKTVTQIGETVNDTIAYTVVTA